MVSGIASEPVRSKKSIEIANGTSQDANPSVIARSSKIEDGPFIAITLGASHSCRVDRQRCGTLSIDVAYAEFAGEFGRDDAFARALGEVRLGC